MNQKKQKFPLLITSKQMLSWKKIQNKIQDYLQEDNLMQTKKLLINHINKSICLLLLKISLIKYQIKMNHTKIKEGCHSLESIHHINNTNNMMGMMKDRKKEEVLNNKHSITV